MMINLTADQMPGLAEQGRFWWVRHDGNCYGTTEKTPTNPTDIYLLDASPTWVAQWRDDWPAAFAALKPALDSINQL